MSEYGNLNRFRHGHAKSMNGPASPEYSVWACAIQRCTNPNDKGYKNYGGRGIKICDRWRGERGFDNFLADMGLRPSSDHSLDRIDNDGNYEPGNCKWSLWSDQMKNRRLPRNLKNNKYSAKLTAEQVAAIRMDRRSGAAIAADYGISRSHANDLRRGNYWSEV